MATYTVTLTEDSRRQNGWVKLLAKTDGDGPTFEAVAKVYDEPSGFGFNEGRVSKLSAARALPADRPWGGREVLNFDRGFDFDRSQPGLVQALVDFCEALPPTLA